jgi:hypothetical protein
MPETPPLGTLSFREALLHHYYEAPLCRQIMNLLQVVADAIRAMHDEEVFHGNLTNEVIGVLRSEKGEWTQAWISGAPDQAGEPLSPKLRGRDNARIRLPSDLLRVFMEMQWAPEPPPSAFIESQKRALKQLGLPQMDAEDTRRRYPDEKDIWIWDDRSMQAIPALRSRDKRKYYRAGDLGCMAKSMLRYGRAIRREMKNLKAEVWTRPVEMSGRIGLSCNLEPDRFEKERRWLEPLGELPLMVRLYHHESEANQRFAMEAVRKLQAEGHRVTVALVQDRNAVLYPKKWQTFVDRAGGALSGFVEGFEVGHAINRVKWGVWNYAEYAGLMQAFENWSQRYPQVPLSGPAGIDFEFPRILPLLDQLPEGMRWSSFSHHMYVDRRGAPENRQSGYDTVDKLAMARAAARVHPNCDERVVVSEVNWPLLGTGVWSPVGSPYQSPGERHNDPSVDEETYADYMRRYILLALCSGMADRVYWWNLAAHGFGLIDDRDPGGWRPRPAYHAFKALVEQMRGSRYIRRHRSNREMILDFEGGAGNFTIQWKLPDSC